MTDSSNMRSGFNTRMACWIAVLIFLMGVVTAWPLQAASTQVPEPETTIFKPEMNPEGIYSFINAVNPDFGLAALQLPVYSP